MTRGELLSALALLGGLLAGACATAGEAPAAAEPVAHRTAVTVTGTGRITAAPDAALVHLGVELRGSLLADVTAEASRRMTAVLERVKALGVADRDIATVAYTVDPLTPPRRAEDEPARVAGYRAINIVQLRIRELAALGRIVDAAMTAGATTIRSVRFILAEPANAEAEARALAVQDAAARARQLADAGGVRLGELLALTEGAPVRPFAERFGATMEAVRAPGPVEPGQLEVVVTVTARYRLAR